jgi:hypothetical protein
MGWFRELTLSNQIFFVLNVLGAVVGIGLMIASGPALPLVLLTIGAIGLALKKVPDSVLRGKPPQE